MRAGRLVLRCCLGHKVWGRIVPKKGDRNLGSLWEPRFTVIARGVDGASADSRSRRPRPELSSGGERAEASERLELGASGFFAPGTPVAAEAVADGSAGADGRRRRARPCGSRTPVSPPASTSAPPPAAELVPGPRTEASRRSGTGAAATDRGVEPDVLPTAGFTRDAGDEPVALITANNIVQAQKRGGNGLEAAMAVPTADQPALLPRRNTNSSPMNPIQPGSYVLITGPDRQRVGAVPAGRTSRCGEGADAVRGHPADARDRHAGATTIGYPR